MTFNTYPYYSPMNTYMPQMPVQAPQSAPAAQTVNNTPGGFMCRPVTSRAEAEVFQIPFDGSTTYFVDTANGKIYSKTFNFVNGTAPLVTYIQEAAVSAPQYATMDDLKALREELMAKPKRTVKNSEPEPDNE